MNLFREHVRRAVSIAGSQKKLADAAGLSQQLVSQLCTSSASITAETAVAIERATNGEISRRDLRPDLWPADLDWPSDIPRPSPVQEETT